MKKLVIALAALSISMSAFAEKDRGAENAYFCFADPQVAERVKARVAAGNPFLLPADIPNLDRIEAYDMVLAGQSIGLPGSSVAPTLAEIGPSETTDQYIRRIRDYWSERVPHMAAVIDQGIEVLRTPGTVRYAANGVTFTDNTDKFSYPKPDCVLASIANQRVMRGGRGSVAPIHQITFDERIFGAQPTALSAKITRQHVAITVLHEIACVDAMRRGQNCEMASEFVRLLISRAPVPMSHIVSVLKSIGYAPYQVSYDFPELTGNGPLVIYEGNFGSLASAPGKIITDNLAAPIEPVLLARRKAVSGAVMKFIANDLPLFEERLLALVGNRLKDAGADAEGRALQENCRRFLDNQSALIGNLREASHKWSPEIDLMNETGLGGFVKYVAGIRVGLSSRINFGGCLIGDASSPPAALVALLDSMIKQRFKEYLAQGLLNAKSTVSVAFLDSIRAQLAAKPGVTPDLRDEVVRLTLYWLNWQFAQEIPLDKFPEYLGWDPEDLLPMWDTHLKRDLSALLDRVQY